jgi:hypothetical protein
MLLAIADEVIESRRCLLRCMSLLLAHRVISRRRSNSVAIGGIADSGKPMHPANLWVHGLV